MNWGSFAFGILVGFFLIPLAWRAFRVQQISFGSGYNVGRSIVAAVARKCYEEICPECRGQVGGKLKWIMRGGRHDKPTIKPPADE